MSMGVEVRMMGGDMTLKADCICDVALDTLDLMRSCYDNNHMLCAG